MLQRRGVVADEHDLVNYAGRAKDHVLTLTKTDDPAPNIRLEYTDEFGRVLTPKEAFRRLSYKFHGKCPGKNKLDKALRKYQEELARKRSSSTDTPLASVDAMRRVQRASHQPHIVLSGPGMKDQLPLGVAIEAQDSAAADAAAAASASASAAGAGKKRKKIGDRGESGGGRREGDTPPHSSHDEISHRPVHKEEEVQDITQTPNPYTEPVGTKQTLVIRFSLFLSRWGLLCQGTCRVTNRV
ncbi:sart-1 family protein dot2 [Pelomyxa schiedti]|nr:sart-1 family protein dot2 [Pelomyxa schiedti]